MGGGKKKTSLTKMEKAATTKEPKKKEETDAQPTTKKTLGLAIPDLNNKKVLDELKGMKALTPYTVASRFNIRLSLAKTFLKELEKRKMAEYVSGGKNLKIYKLLTQ